MGGKKVSAKHLAFRGSRCARPRTMYTSPARIEPPKKQSQHEVNYDKRRSICEIK